MLLADVSEDGCIAEVGLATGTLIISGWLMSLIVELGTIHIIDYVTANNFKNQLLVMIGQSSVY